MPVLTVIAIEISCRGGRHKKALKFSDKDRPTSMDWLYWVRFVDEQGLGQWEKKLHMKQILSLAAACPLSQKRILESPCTCMQL